MTIQVFIQNEAGSDQKNYHDEKRLVWHRAVTVSRAYPFPYGFIVDTAADDGCNVDCFVITDAPLRMGNIAECEVIGLMEQFEDDQVDHNVLARLPGSDVTVDEAVRLRLEAFVTNVFSHLPHKHVVVGRFLDAAKAQAHLDEHRQVLHRPVGEFLDCFKRWVETQPSIQAVALVGSYARGSANAQSDVNLVVLADDPNRYIWERGWARAFGAPLVETIDDYDAVQSVRVQYEGGLEVEFGFARVQWAQVPLDAGTREVINGGMRILYERAEILSRLLR